MLFGTIAGVCGDNPAVCEIGGFKRSGRAHRPCRHCMATSEEISTKVCYQEYIIRKEGSVVLHICPCKRVADN